MTQVSRLIDLVIHRYHYDAEFAAVLNRVGYMMSTEKGKDLDDEELAIVRVAAGLSILIKEGVE